MKKIVTFALLFILIVGCKKKSTEPAEPDYTSQYVGKYSYSPPKPSYWFLDGRSPKITSWNINTEATITKVDNQTINIKFYQSGKAYINTALEHEYALYFSNLKAKLPPLNEQFDFSGNLDSLYPWNPNAKNRAASGYGMLKKDTLLIMLNSKTLFSTGPFVDFKFIKK